MKTEFYGYVDIKSKEIRVTEGYLFTIEHSMSNKLYNDIVERHKLPSNRLWFPYLDEHLMARARTPMGFPYSDISYSLNDIGCSNLIHKNLNVSIGDSHTAKIEQAEFRADLGEMKITLDHTIRTEIDSFDTERVEKAYARLIEALYSISIEMDAGFRLFNKHMDDSPISDIVSKFGNKIKDSKSYIWRFMLYTYLNILNEEMANIGEFFDKYHLSPEPSDDEMARLLSTLICFDSKTGICSKDLVPELTKEVEEVALRNEVVTKVDNSTIGSYPRATATDIHQKLLEFASGSESTGKVCNLDDAFKMYEDMYDIRMALIKDRMKKD